MPKTVDSITVTLRFFDVTDAPDWADHLDEDSLDNTYYDSNTDSVYTVQKCAVPRDDDPLRFDIEYRAELMPDDDEARDGG